MEVESKNVNEWRQGGEMTEVCKKKEYGCLAEMVLIETVPQSADFDRVVALQGKLAQNPEQTNEYLVLGARLSADGEGCQVILWGHEPVPCAEFFAHWQFDEEP